VVGAGRILAWNLPSRDLLMGIDTEREWQLRVMTSFDSSVNFVETTHRALLVIRSGSNTSPEEVWAKPSWSPANEGKRIYGRQQHRPDTSQGS
jgi:hypothetical protein